MVRPISLRDLPSVARVHILAFPDSAMSLLGPGAVRRYYHWQLTGPHEAVALCIGEVGEVTAFGFGGIFRGALRGYLEKNLGYLLWRVISRPWVVFNPIVRKQIGAAVRSLNSRPSASPPVAVRIVEMAPRTFGVLAIAVHPATAGKGQGQQLMKYLEDAAR